MPRLWRLRSAQHATSDLLLAKTEEGREEPEPPPEEKVDPDGVLVLRAVGGTSQTTTGKEAFREFERLVGLRLKFARVRPLAPIRARLFDEFPHLHQQIETLLGGMVEGQPIVLRPVLLVSEPGGGKSRLARRLAEELSVPLHRYDGSGSTDSRFARNEGSLGRTNCDSNENNRGAKLSRIA